MRWRCLKRIMLGLLLTSCANSETLVEPTKGSGETISVTPDRGIQHAIDRASSSASVIVLEPGIYRENVYCRSGITLTSRIRHAAIIKPKDALKYTLNGWGISSVTISDLHIEGGVEFGQATRDFSRISKNVVIANNLVTNCGDHDGIHLGGVISATVAGNRISGSRSQQGIDLVGVHDAMVTNNIVSDIQGSSGMGIVVKAGSKNVVVTQNEIFHCGNAAIACGQVSDEVWIWPDAMSHRYEARDISISQNNLHDNDRYSILVMGALDCSMRDNVFGPSSYYATILIASSSETHSPAWPSRHIQVTQPLLVLTQLDVATGQTHVDFNGTAIR